MELEHCNQRQGALIEFETNNYLNKTTPCREWEIVVGKRQCDIKSEPCQKRIRKIPKIDELCALEIAKDANLMEAEVIAIVLYTGPMVS